MPKTAKFLRIILAIAFQKYFKFLGNSKKNEIFNGKCGFTNLSDFINKIRLLKDRSLLRNKVFLLSKRIISVLLGKKLCKKYPYKIIASLEETVATKMEYVNKNTPENVRLKMEMYIFELLIYSLIEKKDNYIFDKNIFKRTMIFLCQYEENAYQESDLTEELFDYISSDEDFSQEEYKNLSELFCRCVKDSVGLPAEEMQEIRDEIIPKGMSAKEFLSGKKQEDINEDNESNLIPQEEHALTSKSSNSEDENDDVANIEQEDEILQQEKNEESSASVDNKGSNSNKEDAVNFEIPLLPATSTFPVSSIEESPSFVISDPEYKLYVGYLLLEGKDNAYFNFYPQFVWGQKYIEKLSDTRKLFPNFGNIVINRELAIRNNLPAKRGSLLNICFNINRLVNLASGTHYELSYDALYSSNSFDSSFNADIYKQCFYIAELDGSKNEDFLFKGRTFLKFNDDVVIPNEFRGISKLCIRKEEMYYGPFSLNIYGNGTFYIDVSHDYADGVVPAYKVKRGYERYALQDVLIPSSWRNYHVLFISPDFTEHFKQDLLSDSSLLAYLQRSDDQAKSLLQEALNERIDNTDRLIKSIATSDSRINRARYNRLHNMIYRARYNQEISTEFLSYLARLLPYAVLKEPQLFNAVTDKMLEDEIALNHLNTIKPVLEKKAQLESENIEHEQKLFSIQKELNRSENELRHNRNELNNLDEKLRESRKEIEKEHKKQKEKLQQELESIEKKIAIRRHEFNDLSNGLNVFDEKLKDTVAKVSEVAFDGVITSKIMKAAASLENRDEFSVSSRAKRLQILNAIKRFTHKDPKFFAGELYSRLSKFRAYSYNDSINIFTTIAQSFITVMAGEPGIGKTSLCEFLGRVMGLNDLSKKAGFTDDALSDDPSLDFINRFIPVSVERGWNSKKDLIGYYNPLNHQFESPDRHRYDCFCELDYEKRKGFFSLPYIILLDEANLSPMEYYFADFMNVCDKRDNNSFISTGDGHKYLIPDTLRFLATINNDHTTEVLSPRLLDRASVITLPEPENGDYLSQNEAGLLDQNLDFTPVDWEQFSAVFGYGADTKEQTSDKTLEETKAKLLDLFKEFMPVVRISARSQKYILHYVLKASSLMNAENGANAFDVACDYAVAQKVLPQISGNGLDFGESLKTLLKYLKDRNYVHSASLIEKVIVNGDRNMNYYRFF